MDLSSILASDPSYCDRTPATYALIVISSIFFVVATVIVGLRFYTRAAILKAFGLNDWIMLASYICFVGSSGTTWATIAMGTGRRADCLSLASTETYIKVDYSNGVLQITGAMLARASVAFFVVRIFGVSRRLKVSLYVYTAFMASVITTAMILLFFACKPFKSLYDPEVKHTCWSTIDRVSIDNVNGSVSVLSDFLLALLPVYFIHELHMTSSMKRKLYWLFAFVLLPGVFALCRTVFNSSQLSSDPVRDVATLYTFAYLEVAFLLICGSVPALPPLFRKDKYHEPSRTSPFQIAPRERGTKCQVRRARHHDAAETIGYKHQGSTRVCVTSDVNAVKEVNAGPPRSNGIEKSVQISIR